MGNSANWDCAEVEDGRMHSPLWPLPWQWAGCLQAMSLLGVGESTVPRLT